MKAAQDHQMSYTDLRCSGLEFMVDDLVFVKVSPLKGNINFGKKGKLRPRYIGSFLIFNWVGEVAYELALPQHLLAVHSVFHISMLMRYFPDQYHIINCKEIELQPNLSYKKTALRILSL